MPGFQFGEMEIGDDDQGPKHVIDDQVTQNYAFFSNIDDKTTQVFIVCGGKTRFGCTQRERWGCCISWCFLLVPLLIFFCVACIPSDIPRVAMVPLTTNPPKTTKTIRVLLVGDSNWGKPVIFHDLVGKIRGYLPQYNMDISISGNSGVKMINLRHHIPGILSWSNPHVALLYVSSDVSNVNEETMTPLQKLQTRTDYRSYLVNVTRTILGRGSRLAIVGPGILGEQIFKPLRSYEVGKQGLGGRYRTQHSCRRGCACMQLRLS